jgi:hypothetical protein
MLEKRKSLNSKSSRRLLLIAALLTVLIVGGLWVKRPRALSPIERQLVGSWVMDPWGDDCHTAIGAFIRSQPIAAPLAKL